jgi:hypothetical protein
MTPSAELKRFLADHATAESWAAFTKGVGTAPTAATLAAAMSAKGYLVGEAEVVAALQFGKQSALSDQNLHGVVGGHGVDPADPAKSIQDATSAVAGKLAQLRSERETIITVVETFEMGMLMNRLSQLSEMSTSVVSASNSAISSMARNVKS